MNLALGLVKLMGAAVYLVLASSAWLTPGERRENIAAEPFIWGLGALPVFLLFLIINIGWGVLMLARPNWRSGRWFAFTWLIWIIAVVTDFWHH